MHLVPLQSSAQSFLEPQIPLKPYLAPPLTMEVCLIEFLWLNGVPQVGHSRGRKRPSIPTLPTGYLSHLNLLGLLNSRSSSLFKKQTKLFPQNDLVSLFRPMINLIILWLTGSAVWLLGMVLSPGRRNSMHSLGQPPSGVGGRCLLGFSLALHFPCGTASVHSHDCTPWRLLESCSSSRCSLDRFCNVWMLT